MRSVTREGDVEKGKRRPRVLLVGLDRYAMRTCVRLGFDAVVVCGASAWDERNVPIPEQVTVLRVDEQDSPEAVLMALHRAGLAEGAFDAVQTSDERSLVMVSMLARHLDLRGLDPATAVRFRDKSLQKQRLKYLGPHQATDRTSKTAYSCSAWARAIPGEPLR